MNTLGPTLGPLPLCPASPFPIYNLYRIRSLCPVCTPSCTLPTLSHTLTPIQLPTTPLPHPPSA